MVAENKDLSCHVSFFKPLVWDAAVGATSCVFLFRAVLLPPQVFLSSVQTNYWKEFFFLLTEIVGGKCHCCRGWRWIEVTNVLLSLKPPTTSTCSKYGPPEAWWESGQAPRMTLLRTGSALSSQGSNLTCWTIGSGYRWVKLKVC